MYYVKESIAKYEVSAIFKTECGPSLYSSNEFKAVLVEYERRISMDGIGRCLENVFVEPT
jgi:putative transposase